MWLPKWLTKPKFYISWWKKSFFTKQFQRTLSRLFMPFLCVIWCGVKRWIYPPSIQKLESYILGKGKHTMIAYGMMLSKVFESKGVYRDFHALTPEEKKAYGSSFVCQTFGKENITMMRLKTMLDFLAWKPAKDPSIRAYITKITKYNNLRVTYLTY